MTMTRIVILMRIIPSAAAEFEEIFFYTQTNTKNQTTNIYKKMTMTKILVLMRIILSAAAEFEA